MLQQLLRNRLLCIVLALWAVITYSRMYLASHLMPFGSQSVLKVASSVTHYCINPLMMMQKANCIHAQECDHEVPNFDASAGTKRRSGTCLQPAYSTCSW